MTETIYQYSDEVYLTESDLAERLHISPRTIQRQRLEGTGPKFVKAGRRVLYRLSDIEAWLKSRTFGSTSESGLAYRPGLST